MEEVDKRLIVAQMIRFFEGCAQRGMESADMECGAVVCINPHQIIQPTAYGWLLNGKLYKYYSETRIRYMHEEELEPLFILSQQMSKGWRYKI